MSLKRDPDIVESCPLTKLNGGLSRLHSADDQLRFMSAYDDEKNKKQDGRQPHGRRGHRQSANSSNINASAKRAPIDLLTQS